MLERLSNRFLIFTLYFFCSAVKGISENKYQMLFIVTYKKELQTSSNEPPIKKSKIDCMATLTP
jgi:hypothetical protein